MSAGMAIITSTAGGCPEVVGETGLLVEPGDTEGIRKMLLELIESDDLRKKLGKQALKRVRQQFNWEKIARQYIDCYNEVLSTNRSH